jgi:molybdopterin synthase catalytic subunit
MADMEIKVLYFAVVRERLRRDGESLELPDGATVEGLMSALVERHPALGDLRRAIKLAVNQDLAAPGQVLRHGDEVALIPPVSGGAPWCRLTAEPLDVGAVIAAVSAPGQGGIVTFIGAVRDHNHGKPVVRLEYESYPPMVLRTLGAIIERIEREVPGARVAIAHRDGALAIGDLAVVIAASAPHRAEAFEACRQAIEQLKRDVPIWKKEISPTGEEWLGDRP